MKLKTLVLFLCPLFMIFSSCVKEVNYDFPEKQKLPVINCFFAADSFFTVHISTSVSALDNLTETNVDNAEVQIFENDVFKEQLIRTENAGEYKTQNLRAEIGKKYTVKVNVAGYKEVTASDIIPVKPKIDGLHLDSTYIENYEVYFYNLFVNFTDVPNVKNYYHLNIKYDYYTELNTYSDHAFCGHSNSEITETNLYCNGFLFSDKAINGRKTAFPVSLDEFNYNNYNEDIKITMHIYLRNTSEAYFQYNKTLTDQEYSEGDPLSQPVQVYSNIENGLGIFAGYSAVRDSITIYY